MLLKICKQWASKQANFSFEKSFNL